MDLHRLEADARRTQRQNDGQEPKAPSPKVAVEAVWPPTQGPAPVVPEQTVVTERRPPIEVVDHTSSLDVEPEFYFGEEDIRQVPTPVPASMAPSYHNERDQGTHSAPVGNVTPKGDDAPVATPDAAPSAETGQDPVQSKWGRAATALRAALKRSADGRKARMEKARQDEADSEKKTASTTKKNPTKYIVAALLLAIGVAVAGKHMLSSVEEVATQNEADAKRQKAIEQATSLLGQPAGMTASGSANGGRGAEAVVGVPENRQGQEPASQEGAFSAPPAAPQSNDSDDPYIQKLAKLKNELGTGMGNSKPSKLPGEIAAVEVPLSRGQVESRGRQHAALAPAAAIPEIPDAVEGGGSSTGQAVAKDPLDRVAVFGTVQVRTSSNVPYLVGPIRLEQQIAYLYPRNSDPTLAGQWMAVGDQTDDGWTVVKVRSGAVNVVSPEGRVYQIQSGL